MSEQFSLRDKVIIVTGGTGILGNSFINGIVEAGGSVGILGRNAEVAHARADAINAAGGRAELILLPEIGIHGNSHMLMQDKNNLDIADWLSGWIDKRAPGKS